MHQFSSFYLKIKNHCDIPHFSALRYCLVKREFFDKVSVDNSIIARYEGGRTEFDWMSLGISDKKYMLNSAKF